VIETTRKPEMTPKERLLAAFRRQPCDRVPFAPLIDPYLQASLPDGRGRPLADIQYEMAGHVLIRAGPLRLNTPLWLGAAVTDLPDGIEQRASTVDGDIIHAVETPVGSLSWRLRLAPETPYIPWIIENRIRTVEDVKAFQHLIERTTFSLNTDDFERQRSYVGERGLAAILGPTSPLQEMINFQMGMERVIYMLADHPDEMHEMLETYHAKQLEMWRLMTELPADIAFIHDNLSSTTTSRDMYRRYDRRYVNEYADILHAGGKLLLTHWCGKLSGFIEDVAEGRQDGISDVTPPPTGDLDIIGARRAWGGRFVMMGGIDPTLFVQGTPQEMDAYVTDLVERMGPDRRGFILGSGDAVPYGTPPANLHAAADAAARYPVD
jgi:uroporphyrinogen-III decarboxylase